MCIMEYLRIILPIVILLLLIIFKKDLTISIVSVAFLIGVLNGLSILKIFEIFLHTAIELPTFILISIVVLVLIFGEILKRKNSISSLVKSLKHILKNPLLVGMVAPAFIGLLPMPGGALVSAPILEEIDEIKNFSGTKKTFLNYWFRHVWEYSWPLYQGLILTTIIFKVNMVKLISRQFFFTPFMISVGVGFSLLYFSRLKSNTPSSFSGLGDFFRHFFFSTWEILLIIFLIMILKINVLLSLFIVVFISFLHFFKFKFSVKMLSFLRESVKLNVVLLLFSVLAFKNVIIYSDVAKLIHLLLKNSGEYVVLYMFFIPFAIGFLTGVNTAYVAISFPFFIEVFGKNLDYISFVYISGFMGVLLSPLHLCLILSADYYRAKVGDVLKLLFLPVLLLIIFNFFVLYERGWVFL